VDKKTTAGMFADLFRTQAKMSDCPLWLGTSLLCAASELEHLQSVIEQVQSETACLGLPESLQDQINKICEKGEWRGEEIDGRSAAETSS
jgi:hypothetical protein